MTDENKSRSAGEVVGDVLGGAVGGAIDLAIGTVATAGKIGLAIGSALHLPGLRPAPPDGGLGFKEPGRPAGIDHLDGINTPPEPGSVRVRCIDYSPDRCEHQDVEDLESWLQQPKPEGVVARWINIDGLHPWAVNKVREAFGLHTLAAEDVLHVPQRPAMQVYGDHLFVVVRLLMLQGELLVSEQVSMFLVGDTLITFQERPGDVWDPVRNRLRMEQSRLRRHGADFLLYALLDSIVDHCFPLLEHYGEVLDALEDRVMGRPTPVTLQQIQSIRRELTVIRRVVWPTRELVDGLQRGDDELLSEHTRPYLRDVYAHAIQLLDVLEAHKEMCGSLTDLYMSVVSNRMNEIMKVLTIMASLFIPVTFLAGVYGMNFEHIPELGWELAYPTFWGACLLVIGSLLWVFHRRGWI